MSEAASRSDRVLVDADRARLEAAHRRLREAVSSYERFLGGALTGPSIRAHDADEMRATQEAIGAAEDHLWELREELLGWARPSWVPSAALMSDWFSDEDSVYDDLPETTAS